MTISNYRKAWLGGVVSVACGFALLAGPQASAQNKPVGFDIRINHVGISVANLKESVDWYVNMLGFEVVDAIDRNPEGPSNIARIQRNGFFIELFQMPDAAPLPEYRRNPSADLRVHGIAHFAFEVDDAQAVMEELEAKGVNIVFRPRVDDNGQRFFFVNDNSGNSFEFIEPRRK
jgi:methylmalonyl-CoA/ethylmalonyl-CoA epimerase